MSISSHLNSAEALDAVGYKRRVRCSVVSNLSPLSLSLSLSQHIQTYHETNELLRPLGIPTPLKTLVAKKPLPRMPKRVPQWLANNE